MRYTIYIEHRASERVIIKCETCKLEIGNESWIEINDIPRAIRNHICA